MKKFLHLLLASLLLIFLFAPGAFSGVSIEEALEELGPLLLSKSTRIQESSPEAEKKLRELVASQGERYAQLTLGLVPGFFKWPVRRNIISPFGWRTHPLSGKRLFHTGVDLAASTSTGIKAAGNGVVLYARWFDGYGLTVILDHGEKVTTLYAHCSRIKVKEGEIVSPERPIAMAGRTGNATGPHLHFEIRRRGVPVNPSLQIVSSLFGPR